MTKYQDLKPSINENKDAPTRPPKLSVSKKELLNRMFKLVDKANLIREESLRKTNYNVF